MEQTNVEHYSVVRSQRMAACEIAERALSEGDDGPLRWFTTDMLELPVAWSPYVAMAMLESNWKDAVNPFGYLRTVTGRTVKKWQPALVGQDYRERDSRQVLASDLRSPASADWRSGGGGALALAAYHSEDGGIITSRGSFSIGNGVKRNGRRWRNPNTPTPPKKKPGDSRLGPDAKALIDARIRGFTRNTAAAHLGWSQQRVERAWRESNNDQNKDDRRGRYERSRY